MVSELRLVLIILGALVLGALLLHGLWTVRKNAGQPRHRYLDEDSKTTTEKADGFDDLGVGPVRVIKKGAQQSTAEHGPADNALVSTAPAVKASSANPGVQPVREPAATEIQNELPFDEPQEPQLNFSALSDEELQQDAFSAPAEPVDTATNDTAPTEPAEVLILYVLLPENKEMTGPQLLSALLTLGFKYGDMDIFHRHQDSAGSGAVLFSLANMFNPGTFDLENIDKLSTRGVSLFMTLPGPGEPLQNFNLMHNAAKKLAEEFGGQVLDGQRSVLTVQTVRHYVDKIREFQRQQLIHG
ncbi:cell division protein ZipA [Rheinheimera pleomorphica]|uniref:cell division protein ZipA n=1 Tax=Rheinheimera pleomorphica TaxID=2703963 RepID=UPI00141DB286|nr:cell division protein ZipA [Rheinheimera pleomorphica]